MLRLDFKRNSNQIKKLSLVLYRVKKTQNWIPRQDFNKLITITKKTGRSATISHYTNWKPIQILVQLRISNKTQIQIQPKKH